MESIGDDTDSCALRDEFRGEDQVFPGVDVHIIKALLVKGSVSWEKVDNYRALYVVGCITVFCGEVRLIDNIKYKEI